MSQESVRRPGETGDRTKKREPVLPVPDRRDQHRRIPLDTAIGCLLIGVAAVLVLLRAPATLSLLFLAATGASLVRSGRASPTRESPKVKR
jgi:predicted phage tail protein